MKKLLQRVFGVTASAVLLLTSALPSALADDTHSHHGGDTPITDDGLGTEIPRYSITLTLPDGYKITNPEFSAYQIFTGTVKNGGTGYTNPGSAVGSDDAMIPLTDIKWGNAFGDFNGSDNAAKQKIVEFVYALATTPTADTEHSATFGTFHGFDGKTDSGAEDETNPIFADITNSKPEEEKFYLDDRFYTDPDTTSSPALTTDEKTIANVKFDKLATEVADVINKHNDRAWLQAFTDILGGYAQGEDGYAKGNFVHQYYGGEKSGDNYVIEDVPEGYYMILDRSGIDKDGTTPDESYSARMLFVANNITQQIKQDVPSLEKEIMRDGDTTDGHKTEAAGVGDEVDFRLTGQLPSNYDQYTLGYQYKFTDTLSKGLTLKPLGTEPETYVTVKVKNVYNDKGELVSTLTGEYEISKKSYKTPSVHITEHDNVTEVYTESYENNVLTVTFPCLKEIEIGVDGTKYYIGADSEIYIDYTAVVNKDAIVSPTDGNKNTAKLTYSDNPQSYGDTDDTTEEHATVYTFGLDITKVDAADFLKNAENPEAAGLSGAKFILVRPTATANEYEIAKFVEVEATTTGTDPFKGEKYYSIDSWEKLGTLNSDTTLEKLFNTFVTGKTKTDYELETYSDTDEKGHLNISGLNDGITYTMVETETPTTDYAKINPFTITLTANQDENTKEYDGKLSKAGSDGQIEAGKSFSFDNPVDITDEFGTADDGSANMLVANFKYIDLPSTGGVGTYWFYILGAGGLAISFVLFRLSRKKIVQ